MKVIEVTCAIISLKEEIIVVQRSDSMSLPLKWEFPGGKIEKGESEQECLIREIKEELNIDIELISRLKPTRFDYPDISIKLIPYTAYYVKGEIRLTEHKQYVMLKKDKLKELDWAEADIPILNEFLSL